MAALSAQERTVLEKLVHVAPEHSESKLHCGRCPTHGTGMHVLHFLVFTLNPSIVTLSVSSWLISLDPTCDQKNRFLVWSGFRCMSTVGM